MCKAPDKSKITTFLRQCLTSASAKQGNRIKIPPSFCIRQCGEDIFTTIITAVGNKWGIVCKKSRTKPLEELYISLIFSNFNT